MEGAWSSGRSAYPVPAFRALLQARDSEKDRGARSENRIAHKPAFFFLKNAFAPTAGN